MSSVADEARDLDVEYAPRGCGTCRAKKVRCDKQFPWCERCRRRNLPCEWSLDEPSLRERRRGAGSFRSRGSEWVPTPILPAAPNPRRSEVEDSISQYPMDLELSKELNVSMSPSFTPNDLWIADYSDDHLTYSDSTHDTFPEEAAQFLATELFINSPSITSFFSASNDFNLNPWSMSLPSNPSPSLSYHHIPLPNSMLLSSQEHTALEHYQTVFSRYRATKDPKWSTHKILLDLGSENAMVMHLILAVSINDAISRQSNEPGAYDAEKHFEDGAQLLVNAMKEEREESVIALMAAFFFVYLYMLNRKNVAQDRLRQLSMAVLDFVKRHYMSGQHDATNSKSLPIQGHHRNLFARLVIWTYTEDLKCAFRGSGGSLAGYLAKEACIADQIYNESRDTLETNWGKDYPDAQVVDDIENSMVLEFLYSMSRLHQLINDINSSEALDLDEKQRIEDLFSLFEERFAPVFRLSATTIKPRSRLLVNADFDVILFNALRIYYFRSTLVDLRMDMPEEIREGVKSVLTITQKTFTARGIEYHDRLQWPLFLAGIETDDGIYREWVISSLSGSDILDVLQRTVNFQAENGRRMEMVAIRRMFCESEIGVSALSAAGIDGLG